MKTTSRIFAAAAFAAIASVVACTAPMGEDTQETTEAQICTNCGGTGSSSGTSSSGGTSSGSVTKKADGSACTEASQCTGGVCSNDVCTRDCTNWDQCSEGWNCSASTGLCTVESSAPTCAAAPALSGAGGSCNTDMDCNANLLCQAGTCNAFAQAACTSSAQCELGSYCVDNGSTGTSSCTSAVAGSWSGWTYTLYNAPVLECPTGATQCEYALFPQTYLANATCPAGLTCVQPSVGSELGCFDLGTASGIPSNATACTASSQCPAGQDCWVASGAASGSCITPCDNEAATTNDQSYTAGEINPPTYGLGLVNVIATVQPAHAGAPSPTSRTIVPPCPMTPSPGEDQVLQTQAVTWAAAESSSYAPAVTFAERLAAAGCSTPQMLWGTGMGGNYVYVAECPASTTIDAVVYPAACDSVINAIEFSSVSCQLWTPPIVMPATVPYPAIGGEVYVEWDPYGNKPT